MQDAGKSNGARQLSTPAHAQCEVSDPEPRRWQASKFRGSRLIVCRTVLVMQDKAKAKSASRELASHVTPGDHLCTRYVVDVRGLCCVLYCAVLLWSNCTLKGEKHSIDAGEARLGAFPDQRAAVQFPFRRVHGHPVHTLAARGGHHKRHESIGPSKELLSNPPYVWVITARNAACSPTPRRLTLPPSRVLVPPNPS